ncbi:MAG: hypothetical protein ACYCVB_09920, partial [Bacilli bacterium]
AVCVLHLDTRLVFKDQSRRQAQLVAPLRPAVRHLLRRCAALFARSRRPRPVSGSRRQNVI